MKIVHTDNFDRETVPERIVAENIQNRTEGNLMLSVLQARCSNTGSDWYKLVDDDYVLRNGDPNAIREDKGDYVWRAG